LATFGAAEIVLLGHPFDASSALTMGLVTNALADAEVLATAEKIAQELAQKPLAALKATSVPSSSTPCRTGHPGQNDGV
jgi:enoyl-CoA hydratase/carnithine racemase